jgi:hypothetical protein
MQSMVDLIHMLQDYDLSLLHMIAQSWGFELSAPDARTAVPMLASFILDAELVEEVLETLPADAIQALQGLLDNNGYLSWSLFTRRYGEIRVMGPARRDKERPDLYPTSAAEVLWYHALIGKAFLDLPPEPQEYAYIPDDLLQFLASLHPQGEQKPGRPASPAERAYPEKADDSILDYVCTLLAAFRLGYPLDEIDTSKWRIPLDFLVALMQSIELIGVDQQPNPDLARQFLESDRAHALAQLASAWMQSSRMNELHLLPGLTFEGNWQNDPLQSRHDIMDFISQVPEGTWWSLPAFVETIKQKNPDFQRPAGDYESWFIKDVKTGEYLRGFSSWERVDGATIRYMICGPLHWLGFVDLARPDPSSEPTAFRTSALSAALWEGKPPSGLHPEDEAVKINADGELLLSRYTSREVRYQVARFGEWRPSRADDYVYQLTPASLERARQQGLQVKHLLMLLRRYPELQVPPTLVRSLERWESTGVQARLQNAVLLQVKDPGIIDKLQKSGAKRYLGTVLNEHTVTIKPGAEESIRKELIRIGYLVDTLHHEEENLSK